MPGALHSNFPQPLFLHEPQDTKTDIQNGISVYSVELTLHVQMSEGFIIVPR